MSKINRTKKQSTKRKTTAKVKRAVLYARVSTDDQAKRGYSLPTQLEACRKYAEQHGYAVIAEFADNYSGATPIADRPEGQNVVAMLKQREAEVIIVYQIDRLSRDIVDVLASVRDWTQSGIEVHSIDIGRIDDEINITLVVKAWQGADERKKIVERTSRGRKGKARAGKVVGGGRPPYGYQHSNDQLTIIEPEAGVIRLMFELYTVDDTDDGKPLGIHSITRKLSEMGIPTPGELRGQQRTRKSGIWNKTTVSRMLRNETYCGTWHYGKRIGAEGIGGNRPKDRQIAVSVPPIVSREVWEAAQAQRKLNIKFSKRNCNRNYLLRGMVKCGCGRAMRGWTPDKITSRYKCSWHDHHFRGLDGSECREKGVRADVLEPIVWDYILQVITDPTDFETQLREAQAAETQAIQPKREELDTVNALIEQTENEADKLARALTNESGVVGRALRRQIDDVDRRYTELTRRRDELQAALDAQTITDADISHTVQFRKDVLKGIEAAVYEDKRRVLKLLRVVTTVKNHRAVIECRLPVEQGDFDLRTLRSVWSPPK